MAEPVGDHEVRESSSTGPMPVGASATPQTSSGAGGDEGRPQEQKQRSVEESDTFETSQTLLVHLHSGSGAAFSGEVITNASEDNPFHPSNEVAGISDSDSRADSTDQNRPELVRRDRSNSIAKKPTAFKPVSVTKNFLAKSVSTSAAPSKTLLDKAAPGNASPAPPSSTPKPRLVAKLGRDARLTTTGPGFRSAGGPDASKVWNRNRPAPQAPQKQFTDEELKQQYGIHMATRLSADDAAKESKWADIDDDEDDWAPEAVSWMDGAKTTTQEEDQATSAEQKQKMQQTIAAQENTPSRDSGQAAGQIAAGGPGKTILRPGNRTLQTTRPGLILKSAPEPQPELNSPPPRFAAKSPWAQLPPVDKSNPITFHPPAVVPFQDPRPGESLQDDYPQHDDANFTPREIAADSFKRSLDEGGSRGNHLFNSQSGRYEPVRANRRTSFRNDGHFRPASLLQRPSANDTMKLDGHHWPARRDSSINDGVHDQSSPDTQQIETAAPEEPPATESSNGAPDNFAASSEEDARAAQQKAMKERIEAARKRKAEEERREEEERKERIRLKLASLAPLPQKDAPSKDEPSTVKPTTPIPLPISKSAPLEKHVVDAAGLIDERNAPLTNESTIVKDALSETQSSRLSPRNPIPTLPHTPSVRSNEIQSSTFASSPPQDHVDPSKSSINTQPSRHIQNQLTPPKSPRLPSKDASLPQTHVSSQHSENHRANHLDRSAGVWNTLPPSHLTSGWGGHPQAAGNVWGSPSNDKQLGNGAFDSSLAVVSLPAAQNQIRDQVQGPGPIAPPSRSRYQQQQSPPEEFGRTISAPGLSRQPQMAGPYNRNGRREPFMRQANNMNPAMAAWNNLPGQLAREDEEQHAANLKIVDEVRSGKLQAFQPSYQETFLQTIEDDTGRRVSQVVKSSHEAPDRALDAPVSSPSNLRQAATSAPVASVTAPPTLASGLPNGHMPSGLPSSAAAKSSRFFGPSMEKYAAAPPSYSRTELSDGPPPETETHPVYSGFGNPMVKLPTSVKVKLPPTPAPVHTEEGVIMPPNFRPRFGAQPIAATTDWQHRFDGLFNNVRRAAQALPSASAPTSNPADHRPMAPIAAVNSWSKAPLDHRMPGQIASVSLPPRRSFHGSNPKDRNCLPSNNIQSKPNEEELHEDRTFGSSPTVKLSARDPRARLPRPIRFNLPTAIRTPVETDMHWAFTAQCFAMSDMSLNGDGGHSVRIKLGPNQKESIKTLAHTPSRKHRHPHNNRKPKTRNASSTKRNPSKPNASLSKA